MRWVPAGLLIIAAAGVLACCAPVRPPPESPTPPARGLGVLPPQGAPRAGCALYLYHEAQGRRLVLSADSSDGAARIMLDGTVITLPLLSFDGIPQSGFSDRMRFGAGDVAVTVELAPDARTAMQGGAAIDGGSLRLDRAGADSVALPVQGVIACV